jgi:hypothetical protein
LEDRIAGIADFPEMTDGPSGYWGQTGEPCAGRRGSIISRRFGPPKSDGIAPFDRYAELLRRVAPRLRRASTINSTYRSQTAANLLAAVQTPAHNPIDSKVIAVSDAILLSRAAAGGSARSRSDGR